MTCVANPFPKETGICFASRVRNDVLVFFSMIVASGILRSFFIMSRACSLVPSASTNPRSRASVPKKNSPVEMVGMFAVLMFLLVTTSLMKIRWIFSSFFSRMLRSSGVSSL